MKRKMLFVPTAIILMVCSVFFFVACKDNNYGNVATTGGETTAQPDTTSPETLPPTHYNLTGYTIVRPDEASARCVSIASLLTEYLKEKSGSEISISTDFNIKKETDEQIAAKKEILVGETNRPESTAAIASLGDNEYIIAVCAENTNKIIIAGKTEYALGAAYEKFLSLCVADEAVAYPSLPVGFSLVEKVDVQAERLVAITDQKNSCVSVYDISKGDFDDKTAFVASFKYSAYNIADARLRKHEKYGTVLLAAFGSSMASMRSYPDGKEIWSTTSTANNPHAAELLPNGVIAVAASTGGEVRLFDVEGNRAQYTAITLSDAHGVLWDPENEFLWTLGGSELRAYKITLAGGKISYNEVTEYRLILPAGGGHDLMPYFGNKDELWITANAGVYRYIKSTKTLTQDFPGAKQINQKSVKGIGNFDDGSVILCVPDGAFQSWTTRTAYYYEYDKLTDTYSKSSIYGENTGFYKIRVFRADYN